MKSHIIGFLLVTLAKIPMPIKIGTTFQNKLRPIRGPSFPALSTCCHSGVPESTSPAPRHCHCSPAPPSPCSPALQTAARNFCVRRELSWAERGHWPAACYHVTLRISNYLILIYIICISAAAASINATYCNSVSARPDIQCSRKM